MTVCSIDNCDRPSVKRSWCEKHYLRWRRHGDPLATKWVRLTGTPAERFLAKIGKPNGATGCWTFAGFHMPNGYARFNIEAGVVVLAHRFSYELAHGVSLPPKSSGMELDHLCRNRWCVNPLHLELVTKVENIRRGDGGKLLSSKTHCPQGHPYSGDNLIRYQGRRFCRACKNEANRRYQEKRRGLRILVDDTKPGDRSGSHRGDDATSGPEW